MVAIQVFFTLQDVQFFRLDTDLEVPHGLSRRNMLNEWNFCVRPEHDWIVALDISIQLARDEKNSTHLHSDVSGSIDHTQLPENLSAREGFWRTLTLGPHVAP